MNTARSGPGFLRRCGLPLLLGLAGVAALGVQLARHPLPPLPAQLSGLPHGAVVALSLVNPLLLVVLGSVLGGLLAHRVGLRSAAAGTAPVPRRTDLGVGLLVGLVLAGLLVALDRAWAPALESQAQALRLPGSPSLERLLVGALYGGVAEEVMLRWGVMALLAWMLARLFARGRTALPDWIALTAIAAAALLFAAGHLPALVALGPPSPALLLRTLVLNTVAGLAYGWLFWRRQLETAMAAHAATHLGFFLLGWLPW